MYPQWGTADAEITLPSVETPEPINVLSLNPGLGETISALASPTARILLLALISAFPVHSPSFFSPNSLPTFYKAGAVSRVGRGIEQVPLLVVTSDLSRFLW